MAQKNWVPKNTDRFGIYWEKEKSNKTGGFLGFTFLSQSCLRVETGLKL